MDTFFNFIDDKLQIPNNLRMDQWKTFYNTGEISNWFGHKILCLGSGVSNAIGLSLGSVAFTSCALTLGAIKVFTFAITLGNIKPKFSTGCTPALTIVAKSSHQLVRTVWELIYDVGYIGYKGIKALRSLAQIFYIEHLFNKIIKYATHCLNFIIDRLATALNLAIRDEAKFSFRQLPLPISKLNDLTQNYRITHGQDRLAKTVALHYLLSIPSLILNGSLALFFTTATLVSGTFFSAKLIFTSLTPVIVPYPVFLQYTSSFALETGKQALIDIIDDVQDLFIIAFKISEATGIHRAIIKAGEVLAYIPEAIFH